MPESTSDLYAYGNGSPGCLFDHMSGPYETISDAASDAALTLELTDLEREILQSDGYLYLSYDRALEIGAGYVAIVAVDSDWQAD